MPKYLIILAFQLLTVSSFSQVYDLIITDKGDSLACKIDSITDATIFFKSKLQNRWTSNYLGKEYISSYTIKAFSKKDIAIDPETSRVLNPLSFKINQINRNLVYGSSSYLLYHYSAMVNYERILSIKEDARKSISGRIGFGIIDTNGKIITGSFNFLKGKTKNKLETGIGLSYISEEHSYGPSFISPALNLGYRLQNYENRLMFRTGIEIPLGLYVGFGYIF